MHNKTPSDNSEKVIHWFRNATPYVNAHRGRTFVLVFGGEAVMDPQFDSLIHDIAILNSLGIRLVIVYGARPQIEKRLKRENIETHCHNGLRITDKITLECVKEAVGSIRVEIEARLSMGLPNTPMAGARLRVASGNVVTAKPLGVRDGVDYQHTGEVRRIDSKAIKQRLDQGDIVLISPSGYSPTGEIFNLSTEDVATSTATELQADKLIYLLEGKNLTDSKRQLIHELTPAEAEALLESKRKLSDELRAHLRSLAYACRMGVRRGHMLLRKTDGVLLQELFTRDGVGTMVTAEQIESLRAATIADLGGILELLKPLEDSGVLVKRSRELIEMAIDEYVVIEREGMIIGCAALHPYPAERMAEVACLAIHPEYQNNGRGESLMNHIEKQAKRVGIKKVLVLSTQTAHWFLEKGFIEGSLKSLPIKRKNLYNFRRNSKIFIKKL